MEEFAPTLPLMLMTSTSLAREEEVTAELSNRPMFQEELPDSFNASPPVRQSPTIVCDDEVFAAPRCPQLEGCDTVSFTTKVEFSRACASLFQRSLQSLTFLLFRGCCIVAQPTERRLSNDDPKIHVVQANQRSVVVIIRADGNVPLADRDSLDEVGVCRDWEGTERAEG